MIKNKTAIITAASKGIGEACARKLSSLNYNMVIMSHSEKIYRLADEKDCLGFKGSVTNPDDLTNVIRISRFLVPQMKKNGGSIVNISSFGAENPSLKFPTSSVVRSSLTSFSKLFSRRYGHHKIRMNNLLPGYVDSYPVTDEIRDKIALKREATVKEIANTVSFLLSNESSYITGQNLMIDGSMVVPE